MPKLTKAQRAWLERLRDDGLCGPKTMVEIRESIKCSQAGLSETVYRLPDGTIGSKKKNPTPGEFRNTVPLGERITPAGRAALEQNDER